MALKQYFESTLSAAKGGAPWAWAALYDDLAGPLAVYLEGHACPRISDVVLDTFLEATDHLHAFEGPEAGLRAWLYSVALRRMRRVVVERGASSLDADLLRVTQFADAMWLTGTDLPMRAHARMEVVATLRGLALSRPAGTKFGSDASRMCTATQELAEASGLSLGPAFTPRVERTGR